MIQQILQAIDAAAAQHLPVAVRHLLAEQQPTGNGIAPHIYVGNGHWNQIANDNAGTFSYWRLLSPIREQEVDAPGCFDAFQATYNLRLVAMIDRDICGDVLDATRAAATAIRNTDDDLRAALKLMLVDFATGSVEVQSARVYQQEFGGTLDVNPNKALVAIDVSVSVTGKSACFEPCIPAADFFCALIEAKTWAKIKACMTEGQVADAIADLCDDAPCDPLSIAINSEDGVIVVNEPCGANVTIAVTQGGVEVGSWDGTAWIVPECEDAQVTFDGLPVLTIPCGDTGNLDCGSNIESAHVTLGGSAENGIYYISGTAGGKTRYEKNATHAFEYSGTRWVLIRPGTDHLAALGNETYPWLADWTGTGIAVDEGTIGQYCGGNVEPCADLTLQVNGSAYTTIANPCGATASVDVHDSNGNDVGSLVSGAWVVAAPANVLREYTTGGTWNKPTDPSFKGVWVFAAGGGGAGGGGGVSTTVYGGGGGGGGAVVRLWIPAASLGLTETYAIGAGGAGVATGTGGVGGATLFGLHVEAKGGMGGIGGGTTNPVQRAGGDALLCTPLSGSAISGAPGGRGRRETTATIPLAGSAVIASVLTLGGGSTTSPIAAGGAGGGAGGGWSNSTGTGTAGGDGGGCYQGGSLTTGGAGGAVGGSNGTAGVSDIYLDPFLGIVTTTIGLGTGGGGGGGASGATAGGTGAAGGRAAGGGGGGSTQTGTRGASGAGGNGFLLVYEVYAI